MTEHFYETIADWYDLEFDKFDADIELYLGYAAIVGGPALELGCGTGRVMGAIAKAGYSVVGIDSSPAMIERANTRLLRLDGGQATALLGDMRALHSLKLGEFRLIYAAINSFLHLYTREDQLATLHSIRSVLNGDGILVLDVFHPTPAVLHAMENQFTVDGHWEFPDGARLDRFSFRRVRPSEQRIQTTLYYDVTDPSGQLRRVVAEYTMRYLHRFEMEALLREAGYEMEGLYGSYALDSFEDDSTNMIFVAHRR